MTEIALEHIPVETEMPVVPEQKSLTDRAKEIACALGSLAIIDAVFIQQKGLFGAGVLVVGIAAVVPKGLDAAPQVMENLQNRVSAVTNRAVHPFQHHRARQATPQPLSEFDILPMQLFE